MSGKLRTALIFLLPGLIPLFLFGFYPLAYAFYLSVTFFNLKSAAEPFFYGAGNFVDLVTDPEFGDTIQANLIFAAIIIPAITLIALGQALLLTRNIPGVKFLQVVALLPWGIPVVVSSSVIRYTFDHQFGMFNDIMLRLGFIDNYISWLALPWAAMVVVSLAFIWVQTPLPTLLFMAGIQSIPKELHEAAMIDGAKGWSRFKAVTFNWLRPIFFIVLVYASLMALWAFDPIFVITQGGPGRATKIFPYFAYERMFSYLNFGQAGAATVITFAITVVLIYLYFRALRLGRLRLRL